MLLWLIQFFFSPMQWLPLCLWHMYIGFRTSRLCHVLFLYLAVGLFSLGLSVLVEKHFYGRWTLSQANFLYFNIIADVGKFYGTHAWHWYWTQGRQSKTVTGNFHKLWINQMVLMRLKWTFTFSVGWPVLLGIQFPLFIYACGRFRRDTSSQLLIFVILWSIYIYRSVNGLEILFFAIIF